MTESHGRSEQSDSNSRGVLVLKVRCNIRESILAAGQETKVALITLFMTSVNMTTGKVTEYE